MSDSKFKHILELTKEEKETFLNSFDNIISDCDGVLWHLTKPLPNIGPAINLLKAEGKKFSYITNNSVRPIESYMHMFNDVLQTETKPDDILHPARNIVKYLKQINFEGLIYCIASTVFKDVLKAAGFELIDGPDQPVEESIHKVVSVVYDKEPVKCVVIDMDFNANYCKLTRASIYLQTRPNCLFIAGATDPALAVEKILLMGPGDFLQCLENLIKRKATVLGKPGQPLVEMLKNEQRFENPERVLFIGDTLDQDINFAHKCKFQKFLVLSGATSKTNLYDPKHTENFLPNYYADSLADFIEFFKQYNSIGNKI